MEKLCNIREIQQAVNRFEACFHKQYGVCLNEGMTLCSLGKAAGLSSGELSELLGLTASNTSKVIHSLEKKGLLERRVGAQDKRQMFFSLTQEGEQLLKMIQCEELEIPELLEGLLKSHLS